MVQVGYITMANKCKKKKRENGALSWGKECSECTDD